MTNLRVATVFSGIGAFEQALKKQKMPNEIVFACDIGERYVDFDEKSLPSNFVQLPNYKRESIVSKIYNKTKKANYVKESYFANYQINDKDVLIHYHLNQTKKKLLINGKEIKYQDATNHYRNGGFVFDKSLIKDSTVIDVYLENELINKEIKGCLDFFLGESGENGLTLDKIFATSKRYR